MQKKRIFILAGVSAVLAVALIAGIVIYHTPASQLSRQLELGYKYLENGQYEEAALAFEKAIDIDDRCVAAYAGTIQAYTGEGDQERLEEFYEETLTVLTDLDEKYVARNMDYVVEIYLTAENIYESDPWKTSQILEDGFAKTGENGEIREQLVWDYLDVAEAETVKDSYDEALAVYDRLLELDDKNEKITEDLSNCLNQYIDVLLENRQYDRIHELAEKYEDVAIGVEFEAITEQLETLEQAEEENRTFMQRVYDLMAVEDYEELLELDESAEKSLFMERIEGDRYIYLPNGNESMNGIGVGIYIYEKLDKKICLFYYGEFENGERQGYGVQFNNVHNPEVRVYGLFEGKWDHDAPNGEGTITSYNIDKEHASVMSGNLVNGLWDGDVKWVTTGPMGEKLNFSFSAEKGKAMDRTEEFLDEGGEILGSLDKGEYIYTYDLHAITTVDYLIAREDSIMGVTGFRGEW